MIGVPLGRHIHTGATLCCDPISWFQYAKLISNPSVFILGKPGLGKSTLVRRMATGLAGFGINPLVLGDLKPDYVALIEQLGGQVIRIGRGYGSLNVLDPGEAMTAAARLREAGKTEQADRVEADARSRRHIMVSALVTLMRSAPPTDREETIIHAALRILDERHEGVPVLADLLQVIRDAPPELRLAALDRGRAGRYEDITEDLEATLIGLVGGGRLGTTFSQQTTEPMRRDRPVVYDISGIDGDDHALKAASLLACWSAGFGAVSVAHELSDAGLEPKRHYFVILDELWSALRTGRGMVDRVDALTRLNRQWGVGVAMISHTMDDLSALPSDEDRLKARGFVERAGLVICGGLPASEMPLLETAVKFSQAEQELLTGWQTPAAWDSKLGREVDPPGLGHFLVKVGERPGIPIAVQLTGAELAIHNTNHRWTDDASAGRRRTFTAGPAQ